MTNFQLKNLLPSLLHSGSLWLRQFGCQLTCFSASSAWSCSYFEVQSTSLPCRTLITPSLLTQAEARCVEVVKKPLATRAGQRISARSACEPLGGRKKISYVYVGIRLLFTSPARCGCCCQPLPLSHPAHGGQRRASCSSGPIGI